MRIYNKIQNALNEARSTQNKPALSVLQYLMGEIGRQRVIDTSDAQVTKIFKTVQKRIIESVEQGASDPQELVILDAFADLYLPRQMTQQELEVAIVKAIEAGALNIGQVMKLLKQTGVDFDARQASQLIKEKLA